VDELLDGLQQALEQGRWELDPLSDERRLALLAQGSPLPWDELMHEPLYQQALERLP
jgi:beta-N-acetylhexosaminidase